MLTFLIKISDTIIIMSLLLRNLQYRIIYCYTHSNLFEF